MSIMMISINAGSVDIEDTEQGFALISFLAGYDTSMVLHNHTIILKYTSQNAAVGSPSYPI